MVLGIIGDRTLEKMALFALVLTGGEEFIQFCEQKGFSGKVRQIVTGPYETANKQLADAASSLGLETITLSPENNSEEEHVSCGTQLIGRCDLLLAVWNGKEPVIADILQQAQVLKKPLFSLIVQKQ